MMSSTATWQRTMQCGPYQLTVVARDGHITNINAAAWPKLAVILANAMWRTKLLSFVTQHFAEQDWRSLDTPQQDRCFRALLHNKLLTITQHRPSAAPYFAASAESMHRKHPDVPCSTPPLPSHHLQTILEVRVGVDERLFEGALVVQLENGTNLRTKEGNVWFESAPGFAPVWLIADLVEAALHGRLATWGNSSGSDGL